MNNQSIFKSLKELWRHIGSRRRLQFGLMVVLIFFVALAEIISIGAVMPFLGVLISPEQIFKISVLKSVISGLGVTQANELILPIVIFFGVITIIAGFAKLLLVFVTARLSFATGADLSSAIYERTLYQPYLVHCSRNSSEVIDGISNKAYGIIYTVILPFVTLISSGMIILATLMILLLTEPSLALKLCIGFGLIYLITFIITQKRLLANSIRIASESTNVIRALQEGLGGVRDILIDGSQSVYCKIYSKADFSLRRAQCNNLFIGSCPRYIVETLGLLFIIVLTYYISQVQGGLAKAIPGLGVLVLGMQRLLPLLQQVYGALASIQGSQASLQDTLNLLNQPLPNDYSKSKRKTLPFNRFIKLNQIDFRYYKEAPVVLKSINLEIKKGSRIGLIGTTGSGKSTLIDIILGLLTPINGSLSIDGKKITSANIHLWQRHIAHVPQFIFLSDSTIEENIAFGLPKNKINKARVLEAAQQAQIAEFIETLPEKYNTLVGENGVRLSGGQRQRIGIARAIYKMADFIIFDEATSALDEDTERSVMQAIETLSENLTILLVTHRLSTLKNCDQIIMLESGEIKNVGTYSDIALKVSDSYHE